MAINLTLFDTFCNEDKRSFFKSLEEHRTLQVEQKTPKKLKCSTVNDGSGQRSSSSNYGVDARSDAEREVCVTEDEW